jgi:hypothetical protein
VNGLTICQKKTRAHNKCNENQRKDERFASVLISLTTCSISCASGAFALPSLRFDRGEMGAASDVDAVDWLDFSPTACAPAAPTGLGLRRSGLALGLDDSSPLEDDDADDDDEEEEEEEEEEEGNVETDNVDDDTEGMSGALFHGPAVRSENRALPAD